MAKQNCGTCDKLGYKLQETGEDSPYAVLNCARGCRCRYKSSINGYGCFPNYVNPYDMVGARPRPTRPRPRPSVSYVNASGFLGTGVSGFKVIWWSLGALLLLSVVAKGVGIYKQSKY